MSSNKSLPKIKKHHRPLNPESALHVKHRETARVLLYNAAGELLMMNTHWDPGTDLPPRWLTPGGGIDPGESILAAAVRELHEETGLVVEPELLGEIVLSLPFKMVWGDGRYETGVAHFYQLTLSSDFQIDKTNWTTDEHRDVIEFRWWSPSQLLQSGERIGPPGLAEYLEHHL